MPQKGCHPETVLEVLVFVLPSAAAARDGVGVGS